MNYINIHTHNEYLKEVSNIMRETHKFQNVINFLGDKFGKDKIHQVLHDDDIYDKKTILHHYQDLTANTVNGPILNIDTVRQMVDKLEWVQKAPNNDYFISNDDNLELIKVNFIHAISILNDLVWDTNQRVQAKPNRKDLKDMGHSLAGTGREQTFIDILFGQFGVDVFPELNSMNFFNYQVLVTQIKDSIDCRAYENGNDDKMIPTLLRDLKFIHQTPAYYWKMMNSDDEQPQPFDNRAVDQLIDGVMAMPKEA